MKVVQSTVLVDTVIVTATIDLKLQRASLDMPTWLQVGLTRRKATEPINAVTPSTHTKLTHTHSPPANAQTNTPHTLSYDYSGPCASLFLADPPQCLPERVRGLDPSSQSSMRNP